MKNYVKVLDLYAELSFENDDLIAFGFVDSIPQDAKMCLELQTQLDAYTHHQLKTFTIKLNPRGTEFQRKVWNALLAIPYGETRSYKEIAQSIGHPKAYRAVGMACHTNPIGLIIPCHRVLGSKGQLTGYAGGLNLKEKLLRHEKTAV